MGEREPPNCKALTNQRTRWETAALEMRRTFPWVLRSEHYTRFEMFTLLWSQLSSNVNLPLQQLPLQVCQIIPLAVTKAFISRHVFGDEPASLRNMCSNEDCIAKFVINGTQVAFPLAFVVFISLFAFWLLLRIIDIVIRTLLVRYRPRAAWCLFTTFLAPFTYLPSQCMSSIGLFMIFVGGVRSSYARHAPLGRPTQCAQSQMNPFANHCCKVLILLILRVSAQWPFHQTAAVATVLSVWCNSEMYPAHIDGAFR